MKRCGCCGVEKRVSGDSPEFYKRAASKDGFQSFCMDCCKEKANAVEARKRAARLALKLNHGGLDPLPPL